MDNPFESPVIISFCPGILGLERGLERAIGKLTVAAYSEIEAFICSNIIEGMEQGLLAPAPIWSDLKTFPAERFHGKINGIIGGYPCQPFSNAGSRRGHEDPRHLFPYIRDHVKAIEPDWCFFENVRGHLRLGYADVYRSLRELGYTIECGLFSAAEIGATIKRERLFILAISNRCRRWQNREFAKLRAESSQQSPDNSRATRSIEVIKESIERWPVHPDGEQCGWEEPRTIKSGVGCSVNGYNFREDLLRALGNSVVEQTAELAFLTLLDQHYINLLL